MPSFNWIGKEKIVNHDKDVPFRLLRKNKKYSLGESENLILEGDNLEALKALMPFYYGKVKCIYIDPPYNTGNEKWVYNDKVNSPKIKEWFKKIVGPEGEDLTRHDKWLCMMYPRLKLLSDLLRDDGLIFVSIDDHEFYHLQILMNEIFGEENFIANIVWQRAYAPVSLNKYFSQSHDYLIVYSKKIDKVVLGKLVRTAKQLADYKNPDNDPRGPWKLGNPSVGPAVAKNIYKIITPSGRKLLPPKGRSWLYSKSRFEGLLNDNRIWFGPNDDAMWGPKLFISEVSEGITPMTLWKYDEVGHTQDAKREIKEIFSESDEPFATPKPTKLIKRVISLSTNKDDIVLDSFAGSGTTGHAVLDLNKEDGGNRKFILVELEKNIAKNITAERVKRVARGYSYKTGNGKEVKVAGLGGGFEYVELGEPLFDKDGMISKAVSFEDMARYVYFTETRTNLEKKNINGNYLGEFGDSHYFLLFDGIGKNILNRIFLKELNGKDGWKIIYADKCLLDEEVLEKHQIVFKQIPYQIKVY